ncbi:MAG TPA: DUF6364 family protein [Actinophytocola sp.]|uniref:DUF6364 family protein n=1 Tax=Actinophytocola sp. TaxID=1872138 RepID=UPI002DB6BA34|nr:DUF6364 family protein [Actinophytocola sp.]HEU5472106.1 DUF6364 family protein [Actinophytocola sp.]
MAKRNLTVQLDEETIRAVKELAARRGTSVSGLVAQKIHQMVAADDRYQVAMEAALEAMRNAKPRGGRNWTRAEINEDRFNGTRYE